MKLMFEESYRTKGHIDMVFKRYDGRTKPHPNPARREYLRKKHASGENQEETSELNEPMEVVDPGVRKLLMRLTFKKKKISTVVEPEDAEKFREYYLKSLRSYMVDLKFPKKEEKEDKKTAKKKAKLTAKKTAKKMAKKVAKMKIESA